MKAIDGSQLKKLNRIELLELLVEQGEQLEQTQDQLALMEARAAHQERIARLAEDAAARLSGILEAAQLAQAAYMQNLRELKRQMGVINETVSNKEGDSESKANSPYANMTPANAATSVVNSVSAAAFAANAANAANAATAANGMNGMAYGTPAANGAAAPVASTAANATSVSSDATTTDTASQATEGEAVETEAALEGAYPQEAGTSIAEQAEGYLASQAANAAAKAGAANNEDDDEDDDEMPADITTLNYNIDGYGSNGYGSSGYANGYTTDMTSYPAQTAGPSYSAAAAAYYANSVPSVANSGASAYAYDSDDATSYGSTPSYGHSNSYAYPTTAAGASPYGSGYAYGVDGDIDATYGTTSYGLGGDTA